MRHSRFVLAAMCVGMWIVAAGQPARAEDASRPTTQPALGLPRAPVRVGTFDPRAVALAYYRSSRFQQHLRELRAECDRSRAAGDASRVAEIESQGKAEQGLAHRQVFGTGPYDGLAERLTSVWPAVLKSGDVDVVVPRAFAARDAVQCVDVTNVILDELHADQKTRDMIRDLTQKVRSGEYDATKYHD